MSEGAAAVATWLQLEPVIDAERARRAEMKFFRYFPGGGPLSREFYPKHIAFFDYGREHRERLLMAANRVGKTDSGAYEVTCHLTGLYPEWWTGRRFTGPVSVWAAGDTGKTVRDIIQVALLGKVTAPGSGMIPSYLILDTTAKAGVPDAIETVQVRYASGGVSLLTFKSYDQRRESFQGTSQHVIWLDEECPEDIHTECLLRTMDTPDLPGGGIVLLTFTPLQGLTPLILEFLPGGKPPEAQQPGRAIVQATWDDAPHLTPEAREALWASIPPHQRDARSKGIPALGSGAVYPLSESDITIADFAIPEHYRRCFGLDAGGGAKPTGAVWLAQDPESGTWYLYSTHKRDAAEPVIHATAVKARGEWIPGVGDCAALIMLQHDAEQLIRTYQGLGLDLELPDKAVETGVFDVWTLLSTGGLKVFKSCADWFEEFRLYRRDEKGRIVKANDHLMDATRYAVHSGRARAKTKPVPTLPKPPSLPRAAGSNWLGV